MRVPPAEVAAPLIGVVDHSPGVGRWIALAACIAALAPAGLRWLRVAQREHYLPGACLRFGWRWWTSEPADVGLAVVGLAGLAASFRWPLAAVATAAAVIFGPRHLSPVGRTAPLVRTRRLRTLALVWVVLEAVVVVIGVVAGLAAPLAAAAASAVPVLVDVACRLTAPVERRLLEPFVQTAAERLAAVKPTVVGITGSFGKTSTKHHLAQLVAGWRTVVASPASYNNRAGLARAVNEHLAPGTEVFVAEMGTYGPGEIADLCRWCPPDVAVLTAIGPVHLERFGSEERIVSAKAEIVGPGRTVVLNVDDRRLLALAEQLADQVGTSGGPARVVRCSALDRRADVCVAVAEGRLQLFVDGEAIGADVAVAGALQPSNLACAAGAALALGVPAAVVAERLGQVSGVANRLATGSAPSGALVIDDTFNANPTGARAALAALAAAPGAGRRVVVTPGMVELGRRQAAENRSFAAAAAQVATDVIVVGRTNRRALLAGAVPVPTHWVRHREEAVAWVRGRLGPGDVVLYENDLPDHYP